MRFTLFVFLLSILLVSCEDTVIADVNNTPVLKSLEVKSLNGADFSLNFQDYESDYTGDVTYNNVSIPVKMKMSASVIDAQEYSVVNSGGKKVVKTWNTVTGSEFYIYDYSVEEGEIRAVASLGMNGSIFNVSGFDDSILGSIKFEDLLQTSSITNSKACIPCFMVIGAAIGVVACAWATSSASDACTAAFTESCGDGNQCCSMEFEAGACGGDCDITCE